MPEWHEEYDDNGNSVWTAASPYTDGDDPIFWRLKQRLRDNRIEWYAAHDAELNGEGDWWDTLDEAKPDIAEAHERIIRDCANAE